MTDVARDAWCRTTDVAQVHAVLREHGFVILPADGPRHSLEDLMATLGEPVEYKFGKRLTIAPEQESRNSQFSHRGMPLHTDAVLNAGGDVSYFGLECLEAPSEGGETVVASSAAFFRVAPADLVEELRGVRIEYRSRVDGYYKETADGTWPVEAPVRVDPVTGGDTLYIALDDPDDEIRNYSAHVVGYTDEASEALLRRVDEVLRRPDVCYAHRWQPGEIVILDNRRVVHGRAPFPATTTRRLVRLSVA